jgi:hypothetical protein
MSFITKSKTKWRFILIALFLVIVVGIGILYWIKNFSTPTLEFSVGKKPEITENKIADWNTYRNERYKYEIQYPKDWKFFEGGYETDPAVLDITRFFTKTLINTVIKIRVYKNPNENYQKILEGKENAPNPRAVEKRNKDYYFLISYFGREEGIEIFEKMVSTFKFIE